MRQNKTVAVFGAILLLQMFQGVIAQTKPEKNSISFPDQKLIRLATVEWPPYNGLFLPHEGLITRTASLAAKAANYRLLTAYDEWSKSLAKGRTDPGFEGVFSLYHTPEREKTCYLSDPVGVSVIGVASLKSNPIRWKVISDLTKYKLGVVSGYSNGDVFDKEVTENRQKVEESISDAVNIEKLMTGKVKGIVIDKNVLQYMLSIRTANKPVVFDSNSLSENNIHICFKRTPQGMVIRDDFNKGLKTLDLEKVEADYIKLFKYD